jgi:hypothetical protein
VTRMGWGLGVVCSAFVLGHSAWNEFLLFFILIYFE